MADFDPARYSGKWYEIVRDRQNPYTIGSECVTREFAQLNEDEMSMDLNFRGYYLWRFGYMNGSGTLYQCDEGSADSWTCKATMGGSSKRSPFKIWCKYDWKFKHPEPKEEEEEFAAEEDVPE